MRNRLPSVAPSRAEMARRHAPYHARNAVADAAVAALVMAHGRAAVRPAYDALQARRDTLTAEERALSVSLLGALRRGA